jgi:hypothetical protein
VRLSGRLDCPKRRKGSARATAEATLQLWGNGKGQFRTVGRYASATVRGTIWFTRDTCAGTLVRVVQGRVDVFDTKTKKHFLLGPGQSRLTTR